MLSQMLQISDSPPPFVIRELPPNLKNTGFQYVLGAATSLATKVNEETMTYLNQGLFKNVCDTTLCCIEFQLLLCMFLTYKLKQVFLLYV